MKSERRSLPRSARLPGAHWWEGCQKRPSNAIDLEKLLRFSQQLYAHALTLQEVIRNEGKVTYEVLRPRYNRQAAQQFEIFITPLSGNKSGASEQAGTFPTATPNCTSSVHYGPIRWGFLCSQVAAQVGK